MSEARDEPVKSRPLPEALYVLAVVVSSFSMFVLEPLVARLLLPSLGGGPSVWNSCVLFFQITLLAGYLYAHLLTRYLKPLPQVLLHGAVLALPFSCFPLHRSSLQPDGQHPFVWLFSNLVVLVGALFFAISTTAPLLTRWFSLTTARDPYRLYAASNAGGMLGLLAYPFAIEPLLSVSQQSLLLQYAYFLFAVLTCFCAAMFLRGNRRSETVVNDSSLSHLVSVTQCLQWIALCAIPSSLFLGLTSYVTSELSSIPVFWIVPLSIYMVSLIVAFGRFGVVLGKWTVRLAPAFGLLTLLAMCSENLPFLLFRNQPLAIATIGLHLFTLLVVAIACHSTVARQRPEDNRFLTTFFLCVSIGGVIGSCFNSLLAPILCKANQEYVLVLILASICLAHLPISPIAFRWKDLETWLREQAFLAPGIVFVFTLISWITHAGFFQHSDESWQRGIPGVVLECTIEFVFRFLLSYCICVLLARSDRQYRLGLASIAVFVIASCGQSIGTDQETVYQVRNFFGRLRVSVNRKDNLCELWNGLSPHGGESLNPAKRGMPVGFYYPDGPVGDVLHELIAERDQLPHKPDLTWGDRSLSLDASLKPRTTTGPIAVVGLGCGMAANLAEPEQSMMFYEINNDVIDIANNPLYFTYLYKAKKRNVDLRIVSSDGRIGIEKAPYKYFSMIVLDVFSSASIPTHMLTAEALELYFRKLKDDGAIVFNITNWYLDLKPLAASLASHFDLQALEKREYDRMERDDPSAYIHWVVFSKNPVLLEKLKLAGWGAIESDRKIRCWTDDYCNPLLLLKLDGT